MQRHSLFRIALTVACVSALAPTVSAQDVAFVDDYSAASSRYPLPQPQSSPSARRVGRSTSRARIPAGTPIPGSMSREQAAQLFSQRANENSEQASGGALSKLTSGFKGLFTRDDSQQSADNQPPRGVLQAGFAGGRSASMPQNQPQLAQSQMAQSPSDYARANGGLNLRQGDQRQGLFDYLGSQSQSGPALASTSRSSQSRFNQNTVASNKSSRGSTLKTRARNSNSQPSTPPAFNRQPMPQAIVQSPPRRTPSRPLAQAKPSDDVIMVSDEPATPRMAAAPMPVAPAPTAPLKPAVAEPMTVVVSDDAATETDTVIASDDEPLFISDLDETQAAEAMPAPMAAPVAEPMVAAKSAPLPVVAAPQPQQQPQPLMIENPKVDEPAPVVVKAKPAAPQRIAQAPQPVKQTIKPTAPQPIQKPVQKPAARVAVLPNPVKVAVEEQRKQPTERAAALLAEAHYMARDAQSEEEFTRVVQQCRHVLAIDESTVAVSYSNELASWALNKRGELKADLGMIKEAMADFDEAVSKDAGQWRAIHNRGVLMAQAGNFSEAFDAFNKTIELNGEFAKAHSNRASLYVQAGEFPTALADYKRAIMLDPDLVVAHKGRGRVCHVLGRLEEALQHFEAAAALSPEDAGIATCRADLLVDMGRYAQAASGYVRAIEIDPVDPIAHRNLAWLQATCPDQSYVDGERALANAERAIELAGGEDDICLDTLAAAQATAGDFASAVETIKQAISLAPSADQGEYAERLELYQQQKPFRSQPTGVRQASYSNVN